jgi:glycosyltransferase involved in cell wall biosynthesis
VAARRSHGHARAALSRGGVDVGRGRALIWTDTLWPNIGGVSLLVTNLVAELHRRGWKVAVLTGGRMIDAPPMLAGVAVHRLPFQETLHSARPGEIAALRRRVAELRRESAPEIEHVHTFGPCAWFQLGASAPLLATVHSEVPQRSLAPDTLPGRCLRAADWVTAVSESALASVRRLIPEVTARSSVIHNSAGSPIAPAAPLALDPPRLLYLGRLHAAKGPDLALAAFAAVRPRFPGARLAFAGGGPEEAELRSKALALGVVEDVDFLGWVPPYRVPEVLNTSGLVLMPSRIEGLPLAAVEAARMGRPILATRAGGLPEIVRHGETGWLVEPESQIALDRGLAHLLERPRLLRELGAAARRLAEDEFTWKRCVDAYDALYRRLMEDGSRRC